MIVSLRVFVVLVFWRNICFAEAEEVTVPLRNDFPIYDQNLFAVSTPLPADKVVDQALVEEVSEVEPEDAENLEEDDEKFEEKEIKADVDKAEDIVAKTITKYKEPSASETKTEIADDKEHDKLSQVKKQYRGKKGQKSAKFGEKQGHKKGHKTKGYNNRFHKDEYHKEHKLYGDNFRDNHHNNYRDAHDRQAKKDSGFNRSSQRTGSHSDNRFGKKGVDDVGKFSEHHEDFEKDAGRKKLNKHRVQHIRIKDERNPYPNHRPY